MSRTFKENVWQFTEMMEIYKEELEAQERITSTVNVESKTNNDYSTSSLHGQYQFQNDQRKTNNPPRKTNRICVFCSSPDHAPTKCSVVTNVKTRINILRKNGKCFVCFQKGHRSRDCTLPYQCKKCGSRHHISLCTANLVGQNNTQNFNMNQQSNPNFYQNNQFPPPPSGNRFNPNAPKFQGNQRQNLSQSNQFRYQNPTSNEMPQIPNSVANSASNSFYSPTANTCSSNPSEKSVLLETGRGYVCNAEEERSSMFIRFLFDGGAQRSYVTKSLKEKLKLTTLRTERSIVRGFGGHETRFQEIDVVQLRAKCSDGSSVYIEALVVPSVCAPLPNQYPKAAKIHYS